MAGAMPQQQQQQAIGSTLYPDAHVLNSFRIAAVAERLAMYVQAGHQTEASEFFNLCLSLSRGIDYAVANGEVPSKAHELPSLLKQVYQRKEDFLFQAAIMVLMISVKTACKSGWFPAKDADDLLTLTNELRSCYCSTEYIHAEPSNGLPTISKIFARFYPGMKLGHLLASLEIKPGYGAFVSDFNIPKKAMCAQEQNIFLFVAQIDNTETSSCIISPPLVNFLLNGKGVPKRINVSMENGPQFPTNVSPLLRYGTNLLQAVGQFNGNYIMAVVFLSVAASLDTPVLHDHDGPLVASHDSDSEIIEGPSRISLNCPISMSPIKIPVKGHRCKHHQCFDYDNFIKMNLRRPSWRCPHCNQSVTYMDIRIDQFMVKVLREVGETVGDIIISADGSWKPVMQSGECTDSRWCQLDLLKPNKESPANVVDLTMEGMECSDAMNTWETEDRKPFQDTVQGYPVVGSMDVPLEMNNTSLIVQDAGPRSVDSFWSRLLQSCSSFETASAGPRSDAHLASILSESPPMNSVLASGPSNPIAGGTCGTTQSSIVCPSQLVAPTSSQLQASQFGNSILNCDVRRPAIPRNISRTPIAIQALAAPNIPNPHQQPTSNLNSLNSNRTPPLASQTLPSISPNAEAFGVGGSNMETQQFAWSAVNSSPHVASTSMQSHLVTQNWNHQHNLHIRMQSQQQVVGLAPACQVSGAYRGSSRTQPMHHNIHHQQAPNLGVPQYMTQHTNLVQPSNHFSLSQVQRGLQGARCQTSGSTTSTNANSRIATSAQRATNMAGTFPVEPVQLQAPRTGSSIPLLGDGLVTLTGEQRGTLQQVSRTHDLIELPSEQNWRPLVRMRGSLTGREISPSISQFIIQPTEMAQFPRPPSDMNSQAAVFLPPQRLQNNNTRSANGSQS